MIEGRVFQAKGKGMVGPKIWVCLVFGCLFLVLAPIAATAAINEQIQFSGELITTDKTPVSNGNYNFRFELYNDASGGSSVWSETYDENSGRVSVTDGLFSVSLGSHSSLSGVDFNNSSLYLQVYYDPGNDGIYEESFSTRIRLTAAPYAFNSAKLGGKDESAFGTLSENELISGNWQFNDQLRFGDDDFSNYVGFQAPSTVTSNLVWTLPAADGTSGQFLKTNGSGSLSWAAASGVATLDDLTDATITAVTNNEVLAYDSATNTWINQTAAEAGLAVAGNYITSLTGGVTASGPGAAVATVITNANLTGPITSTGNATAVASQTGTGTTFVMDTSPTLVTPALGAATYTTLVGGNITDSALTAGRVTYAGTAGILQDSANMTFDTTNGLILAAGSTSALQLSSTAGTAVGGILFGTDTNLYRSAANILKTDDSLVVGGTSADLLAQGDLRLYDGDSSNYVGLQAPAAVGTNLVWTLPSVDGGSGQCLSTNAAGVLSWVDCVGSSGAPTTSQYVTLALDGTLTGERVLTGTANQIILADGGANGNIVLSTPQNIATTSSPTFAGLALGTGSITMTGSLGVTGSRLTKGWFTDLEVTNAIVGSVTGSSGSTTGNAATVTTNANLTGPITSVGNLTAVALQTGTGSTFVMQASPILTTPDIGVATATSIAIGANTLNTTEWANLDGLNQTLATTSSPQFAGLTLTGSAALDGGITVDTNNFTVSGSTGAVGIVAAQTTGTTLGISYDAATQTGALTGLAVDFTNITPDATNAVYGIKIDDPASTTASTEYGLYQAGTNWDYGAYFDDLVRIADSGLVLNATAVTSTAAELNILDGATLTVTELNYLDGTVVTAGGVIYGNGTYLANSGAGNSGELLTSAGAGTPTWTAQSGISAGQIDSLDSTDFLRATASDTYEGSSDRTLTIQSALTAADRTANLITVSQANDATFNQTAGVLLNVSQADTASTTNVVYIQNAGTGYALAFEQGTTTADGIVWGADANLVTLYRSANDTLYTDDSFTVGTNFTAAGTSALQGAATVSKINAASGSADALTLSGTLGIFNGSDTFRGLYLNYTNANHTGATNVFNGIDIANITGDADATETAINVGTGWDYGLTAAAGGTAALNLSDTGGTAVGGLIFGADTNLYRSAANTLKTDDALLANNLTSAGLTSGRVTYAGTAGILQDSASLTFDGTQLSTLSVSTIKSGSNFIAEGDSITAGNGLVAAEFWPTVLMTLSSFTGKGTMYNFASSGNTVADVAARYAGSVFPLAPTGGNKSYLMVWAGTNDLQNGDSAATVYTALNSYWTTAKADGFEVWAFTMAERSNWSAATRVQAQELNRLIRQSSTWDRLVDIAPLLTDPADTDLYQDGIHPTAMGAKKIAYFINKMGSESLNPTVASSHTLSAEKVFAASNVGIGTITPAVALDVVGSVNVSTLTSGRVTYAGTSGLLQDSANLLFDGSNLAVGNSATASLLQLMGAAGANRDMRWYSGTNAAANLRWVLRASSTAETGSNAGSNFVLQNIDDTGIALASLVTITRSSGAIAITPNNLSDTAVTNIALTSRETVTATASKNFIGEQITQNHAIATGVTNTGTAPSFFFQNMRAGTASLSDTGTLNTLYGVNGNVGHTSNDLYTNPLTSSVIGYGSTLNIKRGTVTNSYTLLGAANAGISTPSAWAAGTVYSLNTIVKPTVANGYYYIASVAGTSHATTEPVWPVTSTAGTTPATIVDNTVTWTELIIPAITNEYGVYITSTTAQNFFAGNVAIGTSGPVGTSARLQIGATAYSQTAWGVNGTAISVRGATYTDTSSSGTVASAVATSLATPTFAASSATTFTNAATLYIAAAPSAGTNVTLTKAWAQWVDAGDVRLDGNLTVGSTPLATPVGTVDIFATTGGIATLGRNDTSVTANDVLGQIDFYSNDTSTTTNFNAARIQVQGTNTVATDINPGAMIFSTTPVGVAAALTEGFRIDNAQKLWIGGGAGLDTNLYRSAADTLYTDDSFTVGANFIATGTSALQGATTESKVNAASGSADALTLSGTLGIFNGSDTFRGLYLNYTNVNHTGATNNFYGIDIAGITADADASEYAVNIGSGWDAAINFANTAGNVDFRSAKADTAGTSQFLFNTSATVSSATLFAVQNNGTDKFTISSAGTITDLQTYSDTVGASNRDLFVDDTGKFGYVSSSIRYKENVQTLTSSDTDWLYNLRPVTFDYIDKSKGTHQIGLIAEDVAQIYPELVSYSEQDPTQPETVSYSKIVVPLLNAVQGMHRSLDSINDEVQTLTTNFDQWQTSIGDALATNTLTTNHINTSSGDLVLTAASGKVKIISSLEVDGQVIFHNDLKVDGAIAGASIDLGDQTSGHGTIPKNESEVFINSQVIKGEDKLVLTPTYNSSLINNNVQLFRGEVTDGVGFKVQAVLTKPLTQNLEFDWLIIK